MNEIKQGRVVFFFFFLGNEKISKEKWCLVILSPRQQKFFSFKNKQQKQTGWKKEKGNGRRET
jgi:hypothetical protein